MQLPAEFNDTLDAAIQAVTSIDGHLTNREMKFLFTLGALRTSPGVVLEIGSFKGRSAVLLSKAVQLAGDETIYAVDPLTLPSATDPKTDKDTTRDEFYANMKKHDAKVVFYEMFSQELAGKWDRPLRLLWIDGDHTYKGASNDFLGFSRHLQAGSIIAFHDVLNGHTGPLQVFAHEVVLDKRFGACGIVGSIGWAQFVGNRINNHGEEKESLYVRLIKLLPHIIKTKRTKPGKIMFKIKRAFISHGEITAQEFVSKIDSD